MEDLLAEDLAAFELRGLGGRAEDSQSSRREGVDHSCHEWSLGANNREINAPGSGEFDERRNVVGRHRHVLGNRRRAGVPGSNEHLGAVAGQFPGEGMFTAPATDDEHPPGFVQGSTPRSRYNRSSQ